MNNVTVRWTLNILILFAVFFASVVISYIYFQPIPPIKYLSSAIMNKDALPGEPLHLRLTFDRRRNCPAKSYRNITTLADGSASRIIYTDKSQQVTTKIGESISIMFEMNIPVLPAGTYVWGGTALIDCGDHKYSVEFPPAGFNVVEKK